MVTSDSLAAESLKGDGAFGQGNPHAAASKQPSHSTTTNTTDTSGATKLAPAVDAETREAQEGWSETQQLNTGRGLGKEAGVGPTYATKGSSGAGAGSHNSSSGGASAAPTGGYAGAAEQARDPGELKPKGKNLTETSNLEGKNVFGEIGSENDPARQAEQNFQMRDAQAGSDAAYPKDTSKQSGTHTYSALGEETA